VVRRGEVRMLQEWGVVMGGLSVFTELGCSFGLAHALDFVTRYPRLSLNSMY
jgi:hypothetical protein